MAAISRRTVAFSETDASGRVHFTSILKWVEDAEHEFLARRGVAVFSHEGGWPRVQVRCDFRRPLFFGDEVEVSLELDQVGKTSLSWGFRVFNPAHELAAEGALTTVWVESGRASEISQAVRDLLQDNECGSALGPLAENQEPQQASYENRD